MKRTLVAVGMAVALATGALAAPATAQLQGEGEGCTPGFYKNNTGAWIDRPGVMIDPDTPLSDWFNLAGYPDLQSATALEALSFKGGSDYEAKLRILLRAATASWLNAAVEMYYPLRRMPDIQPRVNAAIASGDASQVIELAEYLDALNNQECPLDADESKNNFA